MEVTKNCLAHTRHAAKHAAKLSKVFSHSAWSLKIMAGTLRRVVTKNYCLHTEWSLKNIARILSNR
jgi:hypothetical protein